MAVIVGQPCQVLDALAQFQYDVIKRLNRKFAALQRIADLLEQIGDVAGLIPNIDNLLPISSITLETYAKLVQDCPFLGLPPASDASLAELRLKVQAAYASLIKILLNHPHLRLDKLQGILARFQSTMNAGAAVAQDFLTCLQTICATIEAAGTAFQNISQANIGKEVAAYTKNFVQHEGQVLSAGGKAKVQEVKTTINAIKDLSTETVNDVTL